LTGNEVDVIGTGCCDNDVGPVRPGLRQYGRVGGVAEDGHTTERLVKLVAQDAVLFDNRDLMARR
jgi:hypothetical protein